MFLFPPALGGAAPATAYASDEGGRRCRSAHGGHPRQRPGNGAAFVVQPHKTHILYNSGQSLNRSMPRTTSRAVQNRRFVQRPPNVPRHPLPGRCRGFRFTLCAAVAVYQTRASRLKSQGCFPRSPWARPVKDQRRALALLAGAVRPVALWRHRAGPLLLCSYLADPAAHAAAGPPGAVEGRSAAPHEGPRSVGVAMLGRSCARRVPLCPLLCGPVLQRNSGNSGHPNALRWQGRLRAIYSGCGRVLVQYVDNIYPFQSST